MSKGLIVLMISRLSYSTQITSMLWRLITCESRYLRIAASFWHLVMRSLGGSFHGLKLRFYRISLCGPFIGSSACFYWSTQGLKLQERIQGPWQEEPQGSARTGVGTAARSACKTNSNAWEDEAKSIDRNGQKRRPNDFEQHDQQSRTLFWSTLSPIMLQKQIP